VARHAGATQVQIRLSADPETLRLEVRDNGRGISEDRIADARSLGLLGMRERARSFGGEITVHGEPGGEFAERCGVSPDTVRFWERVGLLRTPSLDKSIGLREGSPARSLSVLERVALEPGSDE
jgi:signal transduction histidine kinase